MKNPIAILAFLAMVAPHAAYAELRLARIFTDNMLLQRDQPVRVWGWAAAGENVYNREGLPASPFRTDNW